MIHLLPLIQVIAGAPNEVIGALPQDDECHSDACGLNALQLRSKPLPPPTNETVNVNGTAVSVNGTKKKSRCYDLGIDPTCCQDFSISSWNYNTANSKYRACLNARLGCNPTPVAVYNGRYNGYQRKYYAFQCNGGCSGCEDTGGHTPFPGGHRRREGGRRRGTIPGIIGDIGGGIGDWR